MTTSFIFISVKNNGTCKKNFGVSLNDKDKLDKWTKCQAVIDYGGKIAFMVLCNCVNTFWSGSVKLPRHPNLENISKYNS